MSASERLHALDAVRGFALLLGVALHSAVPYVEGFPGWVADQSSPLLSGAFYVIHIFRMTLFFLIAGFFGRLAFHRKGGRGFVRDRLWRVGVPLVAGWLVLMPAMGIVLVAANFVAAEGTLPDATAGTPAPQGPATLVSAFPWAHLWFLYMLLGFYAVALGARGVAGLLDRRGAVRRAADAAAGWIVRRHVAPLVLGLPIVAMFLSSPEWRMWFGIPSPISGLIPHGHSVTAFGIAFAFGWLLHRQVDLIRVWERRWGFYSILAAASTAACLVIVGPTPVYTPNPAGPLTALYTVLYVSAIWLWVFAIAGVALRFLSSYHPVTRYVSDASYWIYLAHVPVVMAGHVALTRVGWPSELKFLSVALVATAICLASYQVLVRHTFIGLVLNGRRGGSGTAATVVAAPSGLATT